MLDGTVALVGGWVGGGEERIWKVEQYGEGALAPSSYARETWMKWVAERRWKVEQHGLEAALALSLAFAQTPV